MGYDVTAPAQRAWISRAQNIQHVVGAGLVDVWRITGPLAPEACVATPGKKLPPATK
jgi:hypothetical protein